MAGSHAPGEPVEVNGQVYEIEHVSVLTVPKQIPVAGTVSLQVRTPAGEVRGPYGPFTADTNGHFNGTLPAAATEGATAKAVMMAPMVAMRFMVFSRLVILMSRE